MQPNHTAAIPNDLKIQNRTAILNAFLSGEKYTINDISRITRISKQTVQKNVAFFLGRGLIENAGKGTSGTLGGKRPDQFALSSSQYFLCITMWPQYVNLVLLTTRGTILYQSEKSTMHQMDFSTEVDLVRGGIEDMYRQTQCHREQILGVSFSLSGVVDQRSNIFRYTSPSPPDWGTNIDFRSHFADLFSEETIFFMDNVAKMTGRATLYDQEMREKNVFVMFTSWGFPGCFVQKGHIFTGPGSLSGEFCHFIVNPDDEEICRCGNRGCFERQLCNKRIKRKIREGLQRYPDSTLADAILDTRDDDSAAETSLEIYMDRVFEASRQGDLLAQEISEYTAKWFSILLRNISVSFEPDVVVFQGPYGRSDSVFREALERELNHFRYYMNQLPFEIVYDQRPTTDLDTMGAFYGLREKYFEQTSLYED